MTPDFVVTTVTEDGSEHSTVYFVRNDLAAKDTTKRGRAFRLDMRRIERAYWGALNVRWQLITDREHHRYLSYLESLTLTSDS